MNRDRIDEVFKDQLEYMLRYEAPRMGAEMALAFAKAFAEHKASCPHQHDEQGFCLDQLGQRLIYRKADRPAPSPSRDDDGVDPIDVLEDLP